MSKFRKGEENKPFQVELIESERGWGQRTDEIRGFDSRPEAEAFIVEFNSQNTAPVAPDWYMMARRYNYE